VTCEAEFVAVLKSKVQMNALHGQPHRTHLLLVISSMAVLPPQVTQLGDALDTKVLCDVQRV